MRYSEAPACSTATRDTGSRPTGSTVGHTLGTLTYGGSLKVDFDDRVLSHLQIVIGAKLRRGESLYFSWKDADAIGDGRTTIWLHPTIPLSFKYFGGRMPTISRPWIEALSETSNSPGGLLIVPEPAPADPAKHS